ncbi:hypothetical protein AAG906_026623 [Vitis piasezkii]
MVCPPGKWPKCERFYAILTLRCIPGGRTEAPQVIETCWFWLGRLGSLGLGSRNKRRMVKDFLRSRESGCCDDSETKRRIAIEGLWVVSDGREIRIGLLFRGASDLSRSQSSSLWTVVDLFGFLLFMVQTVPHLGRIFGWNFLTFMD